MKIILSIVFVLCCYPSFAQITAHVLPKETVIGESKRGGYSICKITYILSDADTIYTFRFLDLQYSTLTEYKYVNFIGSQTLNDLYGILKSFFSEEHKKDKNYQLVFNLGKDQVLASNKRELGQTSVTFLAKNGYTIIYEKELNRLFGVQ